jgi:hypothetical protein
VRSGPCWTPRPRGEDRVGVPHLWRQRLHPRVGRDELGQESPDRLNEGGAVAPGERAGGRSGASGGSSAEGSGRAVGVAENAVKPFEGPISIHLFGGPAELPGWTSGPAPFRGNVSPPPSRRLESGRDCRHTSAETSPPMATTAAPQSAGGTSCTTDRGGGWPVTAARERRRRAASPAADAPADRVSALRSAGTPPRSGRRARRCRAR